MKKNRILANVLTVLMVASILPLSASAVSDVPTSYNFEDYQIGTAGADIAGLTVDCGTLAVVDDGTGNHVLKVDTNARFYVNVPETTKSAVTIGYRFKSIAHAGMGNLLEFGSVLAEEERVIKASVYYDNLLAFFNGDNTADNKSMVSLVPGDWHTIKFTIDVVNHTYSAYVDGTIFSTNAGITQKCYSSDFTKITRLLFNPDYAASTYYIDDVYVENGMQVSWSVPKDGATDVSTKTEAVYINFKSAASAADLAIYNGNTLIETTSQTDGSLVTLRPTSRFVDNTKYVVKKGSDDLLTFTTGAGRKVIYEENFDGYENGTVPDNWIPVTNLGSTIEIAEDSKTGSKGLKMTIDNMPMSNVVKGYFPATTTGRVKVSYKLRFENHSRWSMEGGGFGSIYSGAGLVTQQIFYQDTMQEFGSWGTKTANSVVLTGLNTKKEQILIEKYIDFDAKNYKLYIDGNHVTENGTATIVLQNDVDMADALSFRIRYNVSDSGTSSDGTAENNGVYWIDDVKVENISLEFASTSPENGATAVAIDSDCNLTFTDNVADSFITPDYFKVFVKGVEMPSTDYTVTKVADNIVKVSVNGGLAYGTRYTVKVLKEVNNGTVGYITPMKDLALTFSTPGVKFEMQDVTVANGLTDDQIMISAVLHNGEDTTAAQPVDMFVAIFDETERLVGVIAASYTVAIGDSKYVEIVVDKPLNYTTNYTIKVLVWDNYKPLDVAYSAKMPGALTN